MPLINDPRIKLEYILKSDLNRPANEQTKFYFKVLVAEQFKEFARVYDNIASAKGPEVIDDVIAKLQSGLAGWENFRITDEHGNIVDVPFDPSKITSLLTMEETIELLTAMLSKQCLTIEDKKKLDSQ